MTILIIDDEPDYRFTLASFFKLEGYKTLEAPDGKTALGILEQELPALILLDQMLPDMHGTEVLQQIRAMELTVPVVMITGHGDIKTAVESVKLGAVDYLAKPFTNDEIRLVVHKAIRSHKLLQETEALREQIKGTVHPVQIVCESPAMKAVLSQSQQIAPTDLTVILQGESGTGKEVVARGIHSMSARADRPFVAVDCGSIPETLVESELFGYEKGAFTGADRRKLGMFELAEGGTIFLDEIGNIPPQGQQKLLRVIQERTVQHLGGKREIPIDVRVIVATNLPLEEAVRKGTFRKDLYYRLNQFTLWLPPLRERKEDVPALSKSFLEEANREFRKEVSGFSPSVEGLLQDFYWPGNIRQLKNIIKRAVLLAQEVVLVEHLPLEIAGGRRREDTRVVHRANGNSDFSNAGLDEPENLKSIKLRAWTQKAVHSIERKLIVEALRRAGNNRTKAAKLLGIDRTALHYKLHSLRIK